MSLLDTFELPMAMPRGVAAAFAYDRVMRGTETPRDTEYRIFTQLTAALEAVDQPDVSLGKRAEVIQRNREFWLALGYDLAHPDNSLPDGLRAGLINLAIWVQGESTRAVRNGTKLGDLIDVNRTVMAGLSRLPEAE
jgi:flagellar biosynthesis activator protein FlaF